MILSHDVSSYAFVTDIRWLFVCVFVCVCVSGVFCIWLDLSLDFCLRPSMFEAEVLVSWSMWGF